MADEAGSIERVPLTDEQLEQIEQLQHWRKASIWQALHRLLAELRASRAREQHHAELVDDLNDLITDLTADSDELQRRIDKVLAEADLVEQAWLDGEHEDGPTLLACWVRAALTGTETA